MIYYRRDIGGGSRPDLLVEPCPAMDMLPALLHKDALLMAVRGNTLDLAHVNQKVTSDQILQLVCGRKMECQLQAGSHSVAATGALPRTVSRRFVLPFSLIQSDFWLK